jgi:hypothetical protein
MFTRHQTAHILQFFLPCFFFFFSVTMFLLTFVLKRRNKIRPAYLDRIFSPFIQVPRKALLSDPSTKHVCVCNGICSLHFKIRKKKDPMGHGLPSDLSAYILTCQSSNSINSVKISNSSLLTCNTNCQNDNSSLLTCNTNCRRAAKGRCKINSRWTARSF